MMQFNLYFVSWEKKKRIEEREEEKEKGLYQESLYIWEPNKERGYDV